MISPTNENGPGNVGFFYGDTVCCNSGRIGLFGTNFTLQNWLNRFADKHGVYYFALPAVAWALARTQLGKKFKNYDAAYKSVIGAVAIVFATGEMGKCEPGPDTD